MDLSTALQIAQVVAYISGAVIFGAMLKADIRVLTNDMTGLKEQQKVLNEGFKQLTGILTQVAVQDTRINALAEDIRDLRHGKGYIKD